MPDDPIAPEPPTLEIALDVARAARSDGDLIGALAVYSTLREMFPAEPAPYREPARALIEAGHFEEAETLLEVAAERVGLDLDMVVAFAGLAERRQGWTDAATRWEHMRTQVPDNLDYWLNAARCQREAGRLAAAEVLVNQALARFPDEFGPRAELAWLAAAKGNYEDALDRFAVLRAAFPDRALPLVGLAWAHAALGQFDAAEATCRRGLLVHPGFEPLLAALAELPAKRDAWTPPAPKPAQARHDGPLRLAVAGFHLANQISRLFGRMLPFRDKVAVRWLDAGQDPGAIQNQLPEGWLEGADLYFEETQAGAAATRDAVRAALPAHCEVRTFPTSSMRAFWPFLGRDDRLVPEPPLYGAGRYPDTDAVAASLANPAMTDAALFDLYMEITETAPLDLDALYAADMAQWEAEDASRDVCLAAFIDFHVRDRCLFAAPHERATPVVTEIARQLLASTALRQVCDLDTALEGLYRLTHGWHAEGRALPIHPRVARHFKLSWWSPDATYKLGSNAFTFREAVIRTMRWSPWLS